MTKITKKITHLMATTAVAVVMQFSGAIGMNASHAQNINMYNYDYGYCDAIKVAKVWNTNVNQAKVIIENKIRGNLMHLIDADIQRSGAFCGWNDVEISYNDADMLSRYWGISVNDSKSKAKAFVNDWGKKRFKQWARNQAGVNLS